MTGHIDDDVMIHDVMTRCAAHFHFLPFVRMSDDLCHGMVVTIYQRDVSRYFWYAVRWVLFGYGLHALLLLVNACQCSLPADIEPASCEMCSITHPSALTRCYTCHMQP